MIKLHHECLILDLDNLTLVSIVDIDRSPAKEKEGELDLDDEAGAGISDEWCCDTFLNGLHDTRLM